MSRSRSDSRSRKRHKLDNDSVASENHSGADEAPRNSDEQLDNPEDCCTICLQPISDRTVIPTCSHEFCFECLFLWTEQSRRCPLCSQNIGEYLIHSIRSRYDYRKRYLVPLRTYPAPPPPQNNALMQDMRQRTRHRQDRVWGTRERGAADESDKLERSISKRRWIYEHNLYAKHVASNAYTKYRPYPTPAQFSASQDLISRTTTFLRRELQVWQGLDVEFLTTLIISLMKSIDIRSESAVKLISEFLDMDESGSSRRNAEHFTHEVYSYVRSPYKDLFVYDTVVQYDTPSGASSPDLQHSRMWGQPSTSQLYNNSSKPRRRQRSRSSTRSSSPGHDQARNLSISATSSEPEGTLSKTNSCGNAHHGYDWHDYEIRRGPFKRSSSSTSQRIPSPIAKNVKGKEREPIQKLSSEITEICSNSNDVNLKTQDIGGITDECPERVVKSRPPRKPSLFETVKSCLEENATHKSRGLKLAPTGSRHPTTDSAALPPRSSDSDASLLARLSDPQTPSIVLPAGGDGGRLSPERSSPALDTLETRARLLARLNREKRLHVYESNSERASNELTIHGSIIASPDLEAKEASLKVRARLHSRLAAEKLAALVSEKS